MGLRAGQDGRKISSPPGFDPGLRAGQPAVSCYTELSGPYIYIYIYLRNMGCFWYGIVNRLHKGDNKDDDDDDDDDDDNNNNNNNK